ncbi:hypothetical protein D8M33_08760, partial [Micrococcus sp. HSID17245]
MTTTTGTDLAPRLRAFKHRLDPNPAQATLLAQYAGAARVAYNMLIAHNRAALAAGDDESDAAACPLRVERRQLRQVVVAILQSHVHR